MSDVDVSNSLELSPEMSSYWQYLQDCCYVIELDSLEHLKICILNTQWEKPNTSLDFNNIAVMGLIEADNAQDLSERAIYLDYALEALKQGAELPESFLCKAHLSVVYNLIGENNTAVSGAYNTFFKTLEEDSCTSINHQSTLGLVYLPRNQTKWAIICQEKLPMLLRLDNANQQATALAIEVVCHSHLSFYNIETLKFFHLAVQFLPQSAALNLQLGIAGLHNQRNESLAYLYLAHKLAPNSRSHQAIYLALQDVHKPVAAESFRNRWLEANVEDISSEWSWANLPIDSPYSYVSFDNDITLTVEASFRSICTCVLIAQTDWFEVEMEIWRDQIQDGMTVIDVGANIGVYTFSAAKRVGNLGKVIAIEPFSLCVQCLTETCRVNQFEWVTVIAGAASDDYGSALLSLNSSSELNELTQIMDGDQSTGNVEKVACFPVDSLIDKENLDRIDWLKIDAEGHEIQVLAGCDRILKEFKPNIIYENIAGIQGANTEVAEYLSQHGYNLYRYRPYLKQLIPITSAAELQGCLNIIAIAEQTD